MVQNAMLVAARPPYSPDLAFSEIYLFGDVNGPFKGESFETGEQLLFVADGSLKFLEKSTLTKFFSSG
jgi:hypothetical protein